MALDNLIHESTYKGLNISIYGYPESECSTLFIYHTLIIYADNGEQLYRMQYLKRDECMLVAQAFIEGLLYKRGP